MIRSANDYQIGERAYHSKTISETDVYLFAGISGDFYPLHVNTEFAKKTRYGERLAHGALTSSLITATLSKLVWDLEPPGTAYLSQEVKYVAPVKFGDTITVEAELVEKIEERNIWVIRTTCRNQNGKDVVVGKARLKVL